MQAQAAPQVPAQSQTPPAAEAAPQTLKAAAAPLASPAPPSVPTTSPAVLPPPSKHDIKQAERHYRRGRKFFKRGDLEHAEEEYAEAARLFPGNNLYLEERELTRTKLVSQLVTQASTERNTGHLAAATQALARAHQLDPANSLVDEQVKAEAAQAEPVVLPSGGLTHIELGAIQLQPTATTIALHSRGSGQELIKETFQKFGITAAMDSSVSGQIVKAETEDLDFKHAIDIVMLLTNSFYVVLDPHRVLVAKDTKENRDKFERMFEETVYMPGLTTAELQEVSNVAKQILLVKTVSTNAANGSITIRAPHQTLETVNKVLTDLYEGQSQVLLKLTLYQIADTKERVVGMTLPSQFTLINIPAEVAMLYAQYGSLIQQLIASGLVSANNPLEILAALIASGQLSNFPISTSTQVFGGGLTEFGANLGGVTGNASLNSSRNRQLDQVQLRVGNQETATFRLGTRYPIITASYSQVAGVSAAALGTAGANIMQLLQQNGISAASLAAASTPTIPNIQYQDLGLTMKATPVIQKSGDISLKLEMTISSLAGGSLNGVPELNNREFKTTIGVKEGEASIISSTLTRQETTSLTGIPGLNDIPGFPATNVDHTLDTTQLVMVLEPTVVRMDHPNGKGKMIILPLH